MGENIRSLIFEATLRTTNQTQTVPDAQEPSHQNTAVLYRQILHHM